MDEFANCFHNPTLYGEFNVVMRKTILLLWQELLNVGVMDSARSDQFGGAANPECAYSAFMKLNKLLSWEREPPQWLSLEALMYNTPTKWEAALQSDKESFGSIKEIKSRMELNSKSMGWHRLIFLRKAVWLPWSLRAESLLRIQTYHTQKYKISQYSQIDISFSLRKNRNRKLPGEITRVIIVRK